MTATRQSSRIVAKGTNGRDRRRSACGSAWSRAAYKIGEMACRLLQQLRRLDVTFVSVDSLFFQAFGTECKEFETR